MSVKSYVSSPTNSRDVNCKRVRHEFIRTKQHLSGFEFGPK